MKYKELVEDWTKQKKNLITGWRERNVKRTTAEEQRKKKIEKESLWFY